MGLPDAHDVVTPGRRTLFRCAFVAGLNDRASAFFGENGLFIWAVHRERGITLFRFRPTLCDHQERAALSLTTMSILVRVLGGSCHFSGDLLHFGVLREFALARLAKCNAFYVRSRLTCYSLSNVTHSQCFIFSHCVGAIQRSNNRVTFQEQSKPSSAAMLQS